MPEESKDNKAKKLAAARKKLKEYKLRGTASGASTVSSYADSSNSGHVSSNISERSESELQLNGSVNDINHIESSNEIEPTTVDVKGEPLQVETVNFFNMDQPSVQTDASKCDNNVEQAVNYVEDSFSEDVHNINAIQVLITEKSQLTTELNKFRTLCREKELEIEVLRVQYTNAIQRVDELTQRIVDTQIQQEQLRSHNAELQHKLAQARAQQEDHTSHINELQQQSAIRDERLRKLDADFKDKCNELELSQLRVRQLSDESNVTKDNRVESLTQTQFMYEQQIRDLQAMVQQMTQDKEQANTQYQTYVQQLNAQVQQLSERNTELSDESIKLQEREKQWVDHIQQLEKEIQKNISLQTEVKEEKQMDHANEASNQQMQSLKERVDDLESERFEFQLKIKSQEDRLVMLQHELKQKDIELEQQTKYLEDITSEQPDKTKLLATMESDKVAASRALTQNVELKKQLDELELRFVELTNDKADLMNRLDSEKYANREMHTNYAAMEERFKTIDERFRFKDDEMIRLSHENEELKKKIEKDDVNHHEDDHHEHDRSHHELDHGHHHHEHDHSHHEHDHGHHHEHAQNQSELYSHDYKYNEDSCQEATEENTSSSTDHQATSPISKTQPQSIDNKVASTPHIATKEAVEKLQQRFTQLMTQCADLTEEKQRLEHLVTQLQSETETIGEYITLYQTQRRVLKQREYERAAQTAMLQAEREQMRERLALLNNLVNSLGVELPQNQHLKQKINEALENNVSTDFDGQCLEATGHLSPQLKSSDSTNESIQTHTNTFSNSESQQILHKIQDIITEIKENTKELPTVNHSVDQLNCCSGKFEVV